MANLHSALPTFKAGKALRGRADKRPKERTTKIMKKIINSAERFIPEMLEGIYAAHPDELAFVNNDLHCLVNARTHEGKVGLATRPTQLWPTRSDVARCTDTTVRR